MKLLKNCLISFLLFSVFFVFALNTSAIFFHSEQIGRSPYDINEIIESTATPETIDTYYQMFNGLPEDYYVDPSLFIVEYNVTTDYWSKVKETDYKGLTECLSTDYPTVYIPVFANIENTSGELFRRVIGHCSIKYDSLDKKYAFNMTFANIETEEFKNKESVWNYEMITEYISNKGISPKQIFMICYPSSFNDLSERVAIIQKENDDIVLLDVSDSCHLNTNPIIKAVEYTSVDEYRTLRMEAEKELYKSYDLDNWTSGGYGVSDDNNQITITVLMICIIVLCVAALVAILTVLKKKKQQF